MKKQIFGGLALLSLTACSGNTINVNTSIGNLEMTCYKARGIEDAIESTSISWANPEDHSAYDVIEYTIFYYDETDSGSKKELKIFPYIAEKPPFDISIGEAGNAAEKCNKYYFGE